MNRKDIIRSAIKKNIGPDSSFGTDPNDPWSAKANINEASRSSLLNKFLTSRGINPKFVSKYTRIGHSKSSAFAKYQQDHQNDIDLVSGKNEEVEPIDELSTDLLGKYKVAAGAQASAADKLGTRKGMDLSNKRFSGIVKATNKQFDNDKKKFNGIDKADTAKNLNADPIQELNKDTLWSYRDKAEKGMTKASDSVKKIGFTSPEAIPHLKNFEKRSNGTMRANDRLNKEETVKEDQFEDPKAATQTVSPSNDPNLIERKKSSKAANLIKSIFKKKVNEELFDTDKESKSIVTNKKAPKQSANTVNKPGDVMAASAVLKGGTTQTGEPRDTILIDPAMKKPGANNQQTWFPNKTQNTK